MIFSSGLLKRWSYQKEPRRHMIFLVLSGKMVFFSQKDDLFSLYSRCSVRSRMTIDVHSFWLLILKALYIRVQKNLHSLFSLWSKFHNGGSKVLTKQFFRNRSSDLSFEPKFYADQEFQQKHSAKMKCLKDMTWNVGCAFSANLFLR